VSRCRAR